jgi:hypothetical protein
MLGKYHPKIGMVIRCKHCSANNHWQNCSCLICGADLTSSREPEMQPVRNEQPVPTAEEHVAQAVVHETVSQPPEERAVAPKSEPVEVSVLRSMLPPEKETYLFQDARMSHAGRYLAIVVLALIATAAATGWHSQSVRAWVSKLSAGQPAMSASAVQASSNNNSPASTLPAQSPSAELTTQPPPSAPVAAAATNNLPLAGDTQETSQRSSRKAHLQPVSQRQTPSQVELEGEKYLYGNGVPVDCERAKKDLFAAAKHSAKAQSDLAAMYATGHCVFRDLPLAYRWFTRAEHNSNDRTYAENMRVLWNQMTPEERNLATR